MFSSYGTSSSDKQNVWYGSQQRTQNISWKVQKCKYNSKSQINKPNHTKFRLLKNLVKKYRKVQMLMIQYTKFSKP